MRPVFRRDAPFQVMGLMTVLKPPLTNVLFIYQQDGTTTAKSALEERHMQQ